MAKLVAAPDLSPGVPCGRGGSSPPLGTFRLQRHLAAPALLALVFVWVEPSLVDGDGPPTNRARVTRPLHAGETTLAKVAELVDALDLGSSAPRGRPGSTPGLGTIMQEWRNR